MTHPPSNHDRTAQSYRVLSTLNRGSGHVYVYIYIYINMQSGEIGVFVVTTVLQDRQPPLSGFLFETNQMAPLKKSQGNQTIVQALVW